MENNFNPSNGAVFSVGDWSSNTATFATADFIETDWNFYVGRFDGTNVEVYINGILGATTGTGTLDGGSQPIDVGSDFDLSGRFFDGLIDEVRIWNRSLNETEITQQYFSNLRKYDIDKWNLYVNQESLTKGNYTYQVFAADIYGHWNQTEERSLTEDTLFINSCGTTIISPGDYTVTQALTTTGTCITITTSDVTLDCANFNIDGDGTGADYGIYAVGSSGNELTNITVSNCDITDFEWGISLDYTDNSSINNVTMNSNNRGIDFQNTDSNNLTNIVSNSNSDGIFLSLFSGSNTLTNITANSNSGTGIYSNGGDFNVFTNITANSNSQYGFRSGNSGSNKLQNSSLINNTQFDFFESSGSGGCNDQLINVNGTDNKPIYYSNETVTLEHWDNNVSEIYLCDASNSVLNNITMSHIDKQNNGIVVSGANVGNSNFTNINVNYSYAGIWIKSDSNTLTNITVTSNSVYGIRIDFSDLNTLTNITATSNGLTGISLSSSDNNTLTNIIAKSNGQYGIHLGSNSELNLINSSTTKFQSGSGDVGIFIDEDDNTIINNIIESNDWGIKLDTTADNNTIRNNTIQNNPSVGISQSTAGQTLPNLIYNNFLNNSNNVGAVNYENYWNTTQQAGNRIFSNGDLIGGNYWTNSTGNGFSDTCADANADGFCDLGYNITNDVACTNGVNCSTTNVDLLAYSDEWVDPFDVTVCKTISSAGTYTLQNNLSTIDTCIAITANDTILDCAGYNIDGDGSINDYGIFVDGTSSSNKLYNNSIYNCNITDFGRGVYFDYTDNSSINNITATGITSSAFYVYLSNNNSFSNFTIGDATTSTTYGVYMVGSSDNNFSDGNFTESFTFGIQASSDRNIFTRLNITGIVSRGIYSPSGGNNNLFYDNYFSNNALDVDEFFNPGKYNKTIDCTGRKNIIGGDCIGGNYWTNYGGFDNDADGIGDVAHIAFSEQSPDYHPLVDNNNNHTDGITNCIYFWNSTYDYEGTYQFGPEITTNVVNHRNRCIWVPEGVDNVHFECNGYAMDGGTTEEGFYIYGGGSLKTNISINNCNLTDWSPGIYFAYIQNSSISNSTFTNLGTTGQIINLANTNKWINISNVTIQGGGTGISAYALDYSNITSSSINGSNTGIHLQSSSYNYVTKTNISHNGIRGITLYSTPNFIHNNFFNTTDPIYDGTGSGNSLNTSLDCSGDFNIMGGSCIGGNYWANSSVPGTGFSETCNDANGDDVCDLNYTISSDHIDFLPILPAKAPRISTTFPIQDVIYNINVTTVNYTIYDIRNDTCWYNIGGGNVTGNCIDNLSVLFNQGNNTFYLYGNDTAGLLNSTSVDFYVDYENPVVTNLSGLPENNSVGGSTVTFNWTVTDSLDTVLDCYPTIDGADDESQFQLVNNNTNAEITYQIPGGPHELNVTCYDNYTRNYGQYPPITYLVAVINFTKPVDTSTYLRPGDTTDFQTDEIDGKDWMNNATVTLDFSPFGDQVVLNTATDLGPENYTASYTWTQEPAYVTITSAIFNNSGGTQQNVTETKTQTLLRTPGATNEPNINFACPNITYIENGTDVKFKMRADLDTLFLSDNLTITDPDSISYKINSDFNNTDANTNYLNLLNYTFNINKTGTWVINSTITDYENQSHSRSYSIYSSQGYNIYKINSSTLTTLKRVDRCERRQLASGTDLVMRIAIGGLVDLNFSVDEATRNISVNMRGVNLTSNVTEAVNFGTLTNETSPPTGERRVALFEMNSSLNFTDYDLEYDYTEVAYSMNDESSLKLWKCESLVSCTLVNTNAIVNTMTHRIKASNLSSFSLFMVTESGTTTITETSISSGGTQTVYKELLNIEIPGQVEIGLKDTIIVPLVLQNLESGITLNNIDLSGIPSTDDLTTSFDKPVISSIGPNSNETVTMFLESHSIPGDYEVNITATVQNPSFVGFATLYVLLVETVGESKVIERVILAQDLFRENPQCLELNDLLIEAQKKLDAGEVEKAREIVQTAIISCKDLVTNIETTSFVKVREWRTPILVVLGLVVIALLAAMIIRKPNFNLYKKADKEKRWFSFLRKKSKEKTPKKEITI